MSNLRYTVQAIAKGSWKWGNRCELRIRAADDTRPLSGRGCYEGLLRCIEVDGRYYGPRSKLGRLLAKVHVGELP
jgi:hypothetical protein